MISYRTLLPVAVVVIVSSVVLWAANSSVNLAALPASTNVSELVVSQVDDVIAERWREADVPLADETDDLTVLRRLSLALHGTLPSLEEIRRFEADDRENRLRIAAANMLKDSRFGAYFAERLARPLVGTDTNPFLVFRRDRFTSWLTDELNADRPWDDMARAMISDQGVWTDTPSVNFVTKAIANDDLNEAELTARSVRVFLGQRIDCAQCHDHPFDHWKQSEFEGIASHFAQPEMSLVGIRDKAEKEYVVEDRETLEDREVDPVVPFRPEWIPEKGTRREKLAHWMTHPAQDRFDRAIVNRVWALMFGMPFLPDRAVDDLPDPEDTGYAIDLEAIDILAEDFRTHDRKLHRLIETIAATRAFRQSTIAPDSVTDDLELATAEELWSVRPLVRIRPEQMIGSMLQASSLKTIDQNSHLLTRFLRFTRENDFVRDFGDAGERELEDRSGTISQALLRMNGQLPNELSEANPFLSGGRILMGTSDDTKAVETAYLVALTRRPTLDESSHFVAQLKAAESSDDRGEVMQDLLWALYNSPEFSWIR